MWRWLYDPKLVRSFLSFVLFPILLASLGEFLLKHAINGAGVTLSIHSIAGLLHIPFIWLGSACILISGVLWVIAMSRYQLSFIYPFFSLNFVVILLGSKLYLHEQISLVRYLAVVLIIIGLIFISRSKFSESKKG